MPYSLPIRIMNLRILRQFLLTCSDHWFLEDGWSSSIVNLVRPEQGSRETAAEHHEVSPEQVESELRQAGFEIVSRQDRFIENDPSNENWWLITARKP